MNFSNILLIVCCAILNINGAKILGVFNHPGASHTFLGKVLLQNLAKKGHEVVMISSFPLETPMKNYQDIALPELLEDLKTREMIYFKKDKRNEIEDLRNMTRYHTEATFLNPEVQKLMNSDEKFDVIIMDWFFNEGTLILGHIFKAPVILMSSFGNNVLINQLTGNSLPFSYVPGAGLLMHDEMSFYHRTVMTVLNIAVAILQPLRLETHNEILKRHFENPPSIQHLVDNIALVLSNSHFSFETPRPYTPNMIPVGGFHVQEPKAEKLSHELREFLDSARNGVIFFSLGSQIKSSNLDKAKLEFVLTAFRRVNMKVLWKYEGEDLQDLPENVKILKWIPQLEVLAHPNVKLFITHGGILSTIESIHFHVPLICMPFNGDQLTNAAFIESRGLGLQISFDSVTDTNFQRALEEITSNTKYQETVNYYSSLLREQPVKPLDHAIFWVEHVIKHGGAQHLKPFSLKLPLYKYYMIDVIAFLGLVIFTAIALVVFIVQKLMRFVWSKCRGQKSNIKAHRE